ncbi:MAG: hypothetical protein HFG32_10365 [Eubacterium sp.]|nr:hypothetical protein [Eubacterium sp.]
MEIKEYEYRSIKKISKKGIWFDDGFFLDFEISRKNWAKKHNIVLDQTYCVADRDITAASPYFEFYFEDHVIIYISKTIFNRHRYFQNIRAAIEEMGYSTYDLS